MTSASAIKSPCVTCGNKSVGIFQCKGCTQIFCRKHVNEHRDVLNHQLDEIMHAHDTLQQLVIEQQGKSQPTHPIFQQIDRWEHESMMKIKEAAQNIRQDVEKRMKSQSNTISEQLHRLSERLRQAQIDDDYVETDLRTWTARMQALRVEHAAQTCITITNNPADVLVQQIQIVSGPLDINFNEHFTEFYGNMKIEQDGHLAIQCGPKRASAWVCGTADYTLVTYQIRFQITKADSAYITSFGIVSKSLSTSEKRPNMHLFSYGWRSDDLVCLNSTDPPIIEDVADMRGHSVLNIELTIDCDNEKIAYFNEQTKRRRELNVDCCQSPFPWRIIFHLFNVADSVRIISSQRLP